MKLKLFNYDFIIRRSTETYADTAHRVVDYACDIWSVKRSELKSNGRGNRLPDVRKTITRTLHEMGYSQHEIAAFVGVYLGTRDTIGFQLRNSRLFAGTVTHREFTRNLNLILKEFCPGCKMPVEEVVTLKDDYNGF